MSVGGVQPKSPGSLKGGGGHNFSIQKPCQFQSEMKAATKLFMIPEVISLIFLAVSPENGAMQRNSVWPYLDDDTAQIKAQESVVVSDKTSRFFSPPLPPSKSKILKLYSPKSSLSLFNQFKNHDYYPIHDL